MTDASTTTAPSPPTRRTEQQPQPRQRWQIVFERREPALGMREREILDAFVTVFREAALPLSETSAARPRPRVSLAASIPVAVEAEGEVLEAYFDDLVSEDRLRAAGELLPPGLAITELRDVWHGFPSAASRIHGADYEVEVAHERGEPLDEGELRAAIRRVLRARTLPGARRRGATERRADAGDRDLRPLIEGLQLLEVDPEGRSARIGMRLRVESTGAGRPDDVLNAMNMSLRSTRVRRRPLALVDTSPRRR